MRRRDFITLLGSGALAWPLSARAQQPGRLRRIGVLMGIANDAEGQARVAAFRQGLQKLGWAEGRNVRIDHRWVAADLSLMRTYAAELVGMTPDVILVSTTAALAALKQETSTIPIVFAQVVDPVGSGLVASLARPGGNITGFIIFEYEIGSKWLDILKEIAPGVTRVAVLHNPNDPAWPGFLRAIEAVASSLAVRLTPTGVRDAAEIERAVDTFAREPNGGLIVLPSATATVHRELIIALAALHRLPAVYPVRFWATDGGLMSYGIDNTKLYWQAASYVDRILKGANPGELPVQLPTKYELAINLKAARALGLDVPAKLLALADEVIE